MIGRRCLSSCSDDLGEKAKRRSHRLFGRGRQEMGGGNAGRRSGSSCVLHAMRGRQSGARETAATRRAWCSGAAGSGPERAGRGPGDHHGLGPSLLLSRLRRDHDGVAAGVAGSPSLLGFGDRARVVPLRNAPSLALRNATAGLRMECGVRDGHLVDAQKLGRRPFGEATFLCNSPLAAPLFPAQSGRARRVDPRRARATQCGLCRRSSVRGRGARCLRETRTTTLEMQAPPS
jgi:hypothetical protein